MIKLNFTFRSKVFIFYSLFVSILIFGLTVSFYIYISGTLTKSAFNSMNQSIKRISLQLDSMVQNMDNISNIILYNRDLQDILLDSIDFESNDLNYFDANMDQKKKVNDILFSTLGTKNIPRRILIFSGKHNYVSLSSIPGTLLPMQINLQDFPWLKEINRKGVYSIILTPHKDMWTDDNKSTDIISFIRMISYTFGIQKSLGYIEIQQPYSMIENICKSSVSGSTRVFIEDTNGSMVYPMNDKGSDYLNSYLEPNSTSEYSKTLIVKNPRSNEDELVYLAFSPVTKWTIMQIMPKKDFMAPIYQFQQIIIFIGILLILVSLFIMFLLNNALTAPIRQLRKSLKDVSIYAQTLDIDFQGNNNEIILLNSAFNKTIQRLQQSMTEIIESRSREIEAHFLALQAQMDPHFLYNSLMTISALGQKYENPRVVEVCSTLSNMLRYMASYDTSIVKLSDEIRNAENYISMMKLRYEDKLSYEFIIDKEMSEISVPKLLLQPLLENSFSHGFRNTKSPYQVTITGIVSGNSWTISVCDNGSGFSTETLEKISLQITKYDESLRNNTYENKLAVGGMAIINIYVRLRILYNRDVVFKITNNINSPGATIVIGGRINQ